MTCPTNRRHGFTLVELLVVIAIISILAGLVIPGLIRGIDEANKLECAKQLRGIHMAAFAYARKGNVFPIAPGPHPRAHDSLNVLLESLYGEDLEPADFVCPEDGEATQAEVEKTDGRRLTFRLRESSLSYAYVGRRTKSNKKGFLCSDKFYDGYEDADGTHSGHRGVIMAIDTSGKIHEVRVSELMEDGLLPGLVR